MTTIVAHELAEKLYLLERNRVRENISTGIATLLLLVLIVSTIIANKVISLMCLSLFLVSWFFIFLFSSRIRKITRDHTVAEGNITESRRQSIKNVLDTSNYLYNFTRNKENSRFIDHCEIHDKYLVSYHTRNNNSYMEAYYHLYIRSILDNGLEEEDEFAVRINILGRNVSKIENGYSTKIDGFHVQKYPLPVEAFEDSLEVLKIAGNDKELIEFTYKMPQEKWATCCTFIESFIER